ncbi:hypothetical protein B7C42_07766 [Nocardia cerradoensis]|uniref:Uncharacterized protein n=1 Tax=Nocardia cerradoensis TaxID=85688 RepID=A0A231GU82_9NOCA|nr:hypothetical protein [Nocardia cerradoensis]OXR40184.1 hypothetical protein B7C42_07766 [Nocardia cerradoensis]
MIPPLTPPQGPLEQLVRGPLAAPPEQAPIADDEILCGVCTLGESGRVLDRYIFKTLDWRPGTRLQIEPTDNLLLVSASCEGTVRITADGYFRVPFRQRRRVGLLTGDRVLLTSRRDDSRLLLHPPAAVATLLAARVTLLDRVNP